MGDTCITCGAPIPKGAMYCTADTPTGSEGLLQQAGVGLGRAADALASRCAGLYTLLRALPAMARVIVGWPKVRQAVVIPRLHVVDGVGAGLAADVTRGAVGSEDQRASLGVPARREPVDPLRSLPAPRRHGEDSDRG